MKLTHPIPELDESRLYDRLEMGGELVRTCARLLARAVEEGTLNSAVLSQPTLLSARVAEEIRAHLVRAHMVSLPKTDIQALTDVMAAIPSEAAKFADRLALTGKDLGGIDFRPALARMEEMSEILLDMTRRLRGFESLDHLKELHAKLMSAADRADSAIEPIVAGIYGGSHTVIGMMKGIDLCDRLNALFDRYRQAGAIMHRISLEFF